MLPWNYGFHWSAGTIIFLGAFYTVLVVILSTLANALWRSWRDVRFEKAEALRWMSDFHDLPARDRSCRHELTGDVKVRKCPHAFDCRICELHPKFMARQRPESRQTPPESEIFGLPFPLDRLYHRGHAWVRPEPDGTIAIGLDELGKRLIGEPDAVDLPPVGARIQANGTAWRMQKRGADFRVLAPVGGEVIAVGGQDQEWYLKVRPEDQPPDTRHLLAPHEVKPWVMRELERMQIALGARALGASLADGGVPVADIAAACPNADWDAVCGEMFLEP
jgi:glycine cleavage system H protein